jgi:dihydroflavonol-4-reductase
MKNVLVTGGAGFLGSAIVRELSARGISTRVMALPNEPMDNLEGLRNVEVLRGNVMSPEDALKSVNGADTLFHCAAIYKDYMADPGPMYQVNMRGTFNMLEAARRAGVEKVIYTASVVALGRPEAGQLADETTAYEAWDLNFHYSRSKHLSMQLALDFARWGLDVRVVCPAVVFGPGDIAPTPSGKLILNVCNGKAPAYTSGGFTYVDVRDAARVHVLAAEKGKAGNVYIASGHNMDNESFVKTVMKVYARALPVPRKLPGLIAQAAVVGMGFAALKQGKEPEMTREYLMYAMKPGYFSNAKATVELGATFRPIEETITDAIAYFRKRGLVAA